MAAPVEPAPPASAGSTEAPGAELQRPSKRAPVATTAPDATPEPPASAPATAEPTEAEPPSESAPAAAAAVGDGSPLDELVQAWPAIVAELSASPPIKPLIKVCRPIAVDGDVVTLGFPEGQSFLKDVAERRRSTLEQVIGHNLGRSVAVRLEATNLEPLPETAVDDEAERIMDAARRIFAEELVDAGEVT